MTVEIINHYDIRMLAAASEEQQQARIPAIDAPSPMDDEDEQCVTCNRCGEANLHWQQVIAADGKSDTYRLFNRRGRPHVCPPPSADAFEAVPE
jgi:hypothetical protein